MLWCLSSDSNEVDFEGETNIIIGLLLENEFVIVK